MFKSLSQLNEKERLIDIYGKISTFAIFSYGISYALLFSATKIFYICLIASALIIVAILIARKLWLKTAAWIIYLSSLFVIFGSSLFVYGVRSPILFWLAIMPQVGNYLGISLSKTLSSMSLSFFSFILAIKYCHFLPELTEQNLLIASFFALIGICIVNLLFRKINEQVLVRKNSKLESTLNALKTTQHQLIEKEKLATIGVMSTGISHEFNNTLNNLKQAIVALEILIKEKDESQAIELIRDMDKVITLSADTIKSIKGLQKIEDQKKKIDLFSFINTICNLYKGLTFDHFNIQNNIHAGIKIEVNELVLYNTLANLIKNAIEASENSANKKILIESVTEDHIVKIDISDFGSGIKETAKNTIFDGISSKEEGLGFGLKNSKENLKKIKGDLELINLQNPTTFRITLKV